MHPGPEPIMPFKLPIMLLNNAPKFPYCAPIMLHCTQLCSIMFHKFIKMLLPVREGKSVSLTKCILKQLRALNFNATCQLTNSSIRVY